MSKPLSTVSILFLMVFLLFVGAVMGAGVVLWHVTTVTQPAAMKVIDELKETVSLQQAMLTTRCGHATAGDLLQDGRIPIPKPSYTGDPIQ